MRQNINKHKRPVILFIPEAGIYPFLRGLSVLGDAVQKQGGKVLITRDTGQMIRSPIMAMHKLSVDATMKDRSFIYRATEQYLKKVKQNYNFSFIELSDFVDNDLIEEINKLIVNGKKNLRSIKYRGFPVGEISQYDFILETKFPYSQKFSKKHREIYSAYIKNTALTIAITEAICKKYDPSLFLTYNEYAQGQAVRYVAEKNGIRRMALTYPVHYNFDASRFSIWETTCEYWLYRHCQNWKMFSKYPVSVQNVLECWNDTVFRMYTASSHVFSSRKEGNPELIFQKLKLKQKRKTIVVYTSSQDERTSFEVGMKIWGEDNHVVDAFSNQIEWLLWLKDYAKVHMGIQIVVRIHPREGKRQRGYESQHLLLLKNKFKNNTENFIIVWPDDPVSSYDLMELADVVLVAWSLMGQEATRLGIPTLAYAGNMFYPDDDFIQVATSKKEYKKRLDALIVKQYTWNELVKAVRFYQWRNLIPALELGNTVPRDFGDDTIWPKAPRSKIKILNDVLSGKQDLINFNIKKWKKSLTINSARQESEAMKRGIRYFLDSVFYPPAPVKNLNIFFLIFRRLWREITGRNIPFKKPEKIFKDYRLKISNDTSKLNDFIEQTKTDNGLRFVVINRSIAILVNEGKTVSRMSLVIVKLAKLYS